jgi:hypothetical protein
MKAWRAFYGLPARHSITFPNVAARAGELVPYEAEQEAIHGNVSLRAQEKALRLIAEAVAAKGHTFGDKLGVPFVRSVVPCHRAA